MRLNDKIEQPADLRAWLVKKTKRFREAPSVAFLDSRLPCVQIDTLGRHRVLLERLPINSGLLGPASGLACNGACWTLVRESGKSLPSSFEVERPVRVKAEWAGQSAFVY